MIVSTAIAVLPVWRSPIISSRWPRPIGIIESITFKPVWTGWCTDLRVITPGATRSIGRNLSALISGPPSIAWPNALTTRPSRSSPTGTSTILPVRFTVSPSLISVSLPIKTAPTCSSSRFSTIPYTSCGNNSNSPDMAFSSPWIRAIPSPIVITVPVSATSSSSS